jgi:electron transport complex protein RnfB
MQACPVDAIVGAAKQMHTVVASECTGCDLCVEPCPVDCIELMPIPVTVGNWHWDLPRGGTGPLIIASDAAGERAA